MTRTAFAKAEQFMLQTMQGATHDVQHVRRVLGYALLLCEGTGANRDIVALAALLHDIGRPEQDADPSLDHAAVGAEKARAFLLAEGFGVEMADAVADCVGRHRFRKGGAPDTLEAQIVYDADKLDVSGAMGVARTLQFGGEIGEPAYNTDAAGKPLPGEREEPDSFLRECRQKLCLLPARMFTPRARQICQARMALVENFADALWAEACEAHEMITEASLEELFEEGGGAGG